MRLLLTLCLFFATAPSASAENWSRLRGPNGAGQGGDVEFPAQWTANDYAWSATLPGRGHSSPVGWEDQVFVTSGAATTGDVTLHCFDAATGRQRWSKRFPGAAEKMHGNNSYASSTPVVDGRHVYLSYVSPDGTTLLAIDHDGQIQWRSVLGTFAGEHGFAASPMIVDGVVCLQIEQADRSGLMGIDSGSGKIRWIANRPAGKASYATPCIVESKSAGDARTVVVDNAMSGGMRAIDVDSGDVVWQLPRAFPERCVSSPLLAGGLVFGVSGGGGVGRTLIGVEPSGAQEKPPEIRWRMKRGLPYVPTMVADGERLFLWQDRGVVACFDLRSQRRLWESRVGGNYYGSPVACGGKIYCISREGQVVVVAVADTFKLLGKNDLGEGSHACPAVHADRLYFRTETQLHCLEPINSSPAQARQPQPQAGPDSERGIAARRSR